jgi:hypothetical protein
MKITVVQEQQRQCNNPMCDNKFPVHDPAKKFCSDQCRKKITRNTARHHRTVEKPRRCQWCPNNFQGDLWQLLCADCVALRDNERTRFVAVDGEGFTGRCMECDCADFTGVEDGGKVCTCGHNKNGKVTDAKTGHAHVYKLIGCGAEQITNNDGLAWHEIFAFLYEQFESYEHGRTAFVGFFLGYDFAQWCKTLPPGRGKHLMLGKRRSSSPNMRHIVLPVECGDWQFDIMGERRFKFRPKTCSCTRYTCDHMKGIPWMYVCDSGPFFQTSFMNVISPFKWNGASQPEPCETCKATLAVWKSRPKSEIRPGDSYCPDHMIVSPDEFCKVLAGKEQREDAKLTAENMEYNRLENEILARVMTQLDQGFRAIGVKLNIDQWFGPGQAAANWLTNRAPRHDKLVKYVPEHALQAAMSSYFGGHFEIYAHGLVPGITHEYDINSAYPASIQYLPCLKHGKWSEPIFPREYGLRKFKPGQLVLVRGSADGSNPHIGTMMHRFDERVLPMPGTHGAYRIYRPHHTFGWFWLHELEASIAAGLVDEAIAVEYITFTPGKCPDGCNERPLREVANLYLKRLAAGKSSPIGIGCKLAYNSQYGKFAQSVGDNPPFNNWIYASLITSNCRTQILNAIATHPGAPCAECRGQGRHGGPCNTLMIATDGIYFRTPHPGLTCSEQLGDWEYAEHSNMTLFKPGFYWDDESRESIAKGEAPKFKSRGVSAKAVSTVIAEVDDVFRTWRGPVTHVNGKVDALNWPGAEFTMPFSMTTARQAAQWNRWDACGHVSERRGKQSSDATQKRDIGAYDEAAGFYRSRPYPGKLVDGMWEHSVGYDPTEGLSALQDMGERIDDGMTPDGPMATLFPDMFKGE